MASVRTIKNQSAEIKGSIFGVTFFLRLSDFVELNLDFSMKNSRMQRLKVFLLIKFKLTPQRVRFAS
jgi:hypothetical protein